MQSRIAGRNFLFVPGPTNVPDRVQRAMHGGDGRPPLLEVPRAFDERAERSEEGLQDQPAGQVFIFPSSGTGAWEAALTNTLSPGDKILAARFGQFSHLWIDMAQRLGYEVEILEVEWGEGVPLDRYAEILGADTRHQIKGVLACQNETATGVTSDIAGVRRALDASNHPALLFVDAVSSLASIDFRMDEWRVDLAVSGSQKGLMLPAGLGILGVSQKAISAMAGAKSRRCYFDLADMIKANATGLFPVYPGLTHALRAARVLEHHRRRGPGDYLLPAPLPGRRRARSDHRRLAPEACAPRNPSGIRIP